MSYTLDYDEPLEKVVKRLENEHKEIEPKLAKIYEESKNGDLKVAESLLSSIREVMLRHAVEEEARLMRTIVWELEEESQPSISIMRWHRELASFFKSTLPSMPTLPDSVARREIQIFVNDLRKHHAEEERITFPLALKADALNKKSAQGPQAKVTE